MGTLYIVATPIGNLSDITQRALDTLRTVDLIACEDTRQTRKLLNHYDIQKRLVSYHDFNEEKQSAELGGQIQTGLNVALVSDAGTPAISDPGYRLVRYCRDHGIPVVSIPGPSAIVTALAASGIPGNEFHFVGFLPSKKTARRDQLQGLRQLKCPLIFYEAPHRILETLEDLQEILGDRLACVGRELTKVHEEYLFGKLSDIRLRTKELGEFVLVVEGGSGEETAAPPRALTRADVLRKLGMSRNELYELFFKK
jgi:16S rRNA (cytidine1402-2'-O)-methyltransferase